MAGVDLSQAVDVDLDNENIVTVETLENSDISLKKAKERYREEQTRLEGTQDDLEDGDRTVTELIDILPALKRGAFSLHFGEYCL